MAVNSNRKLKLFKCEARRAIKQFVLRLAVFPQQDAAWHNRRDGFLPWHNRRGVTQFWQGTSGGWTLTSVERANKSEPRAYGAGLFQAPPGTVSAMSVKLVEECEARKPKEPGFEAMASWVRAAR